MVSGQANSGSRATIYGKLRTHKGNLVRYEINLLCLILLRIFCTEDASGFAFVKFKGKLKLCLRFFFMSDIGFPRYSLNLYEQ